MTEPYYQDDHVTLYHGDSLDILATLTYDAMITDPPYGIGWKRGANYRRGSQPHDGIANDDTTETRNAALRLCGDRPAIVFGSVYLPPPDGTRHVAIWQKPADAGVVGSTIGLRRDVEAIYFLGNLERRPCNQSSVLTSRIPSIGNPYSPAGRFGHPHAKPEDLMRQLFDFVAPDAVIVDPFAGSGSTLRAAKDLGRQAIGIELKEQYCKTIVRRLAQEVLAL